MGVRSRSGKTTKTASKVKASATKEKETLETPEQETSLWGKVFDRDVALSTDEALEASHWVRQASGILLGSIFGTLQLTGFPAIFVFFMVAFAGPSTFLSYFNELDIDEISKTGSMQTEGFMPSFALFVLFWVITYTIRLPPSS